VNYREAMDVVCRSAGRDFFEWLVLEGAPAEPETPWVPMEEQLAAADAIGRDLFEHGLYPELDAWPPADPERAEILCSILEVAKGDVLAEMWWGKFRHMIRRPEHRARVIAWIEEKLGSPVSDYGPGGRPLAIATRRGQSSRD
jgi:hypothetical protein